MAKYFDFCHFIPYNDKIADLQQNDIAKHIETIAAFPPNTVAMILRADRQAGSGNFLAYPNQGTYSVVLNTDGAKLYAGVGNTIQWANSVANDDWDIYCFGYFVQSPVRHEI